MPNWCDSRYAFYTHDENKSELLRLHKNLSDVMNTPSVTKNHFEFGWFGRLAETHGIDCEKISYRGTIEDLGEYEPGSNFFILDTTSAWCPLEDFWNAIIAKYEGLSFVYRAEEPGAPFYVNTDNTGLYLPEKFLLEIFGDAPIPEGWFSDKDKPGCLEIRDYFDDADSLRAYCAEITGQNFDTIDELRDYLSDVFKDAVNIIAYVHEFTAEQEVFLC